ncbi:lanthionine synthetase LanC family protein [Euzebya tangerina]|uniref:lanthionine synthetase LanC family protein n=1 Tax=Euzebya tangerina TaxID=591198 RepID=UPI0013C32CD4|nr:lanthionine synthetase LanC family protein [Euzebya tangerina]
MSAAGRTDTGPRLAAAVDRAVDVLVRTAVQTGDDVTWPSWVMGPDGEPTGLTGGNATVYDGDAGIVWALHALADATGRQDVADLAQRSRRGVVNRPTKSLPAGLLDGVAGLSLLDPRDHDRPTQPAPGPARAPRRSADLTSGVAGVGLAASRVGCSRDQAGEFLLSLRDQALDRDAIGDTAIGLAWADPSPDGVAVPLCGLSHGASGVALAVAELAAVHRDLPGAAELIGGALRWESTWFDVQAGGWPDLRPDVVQTGMTYPALWCHGAAGIGATRLRLLALAAEGVDLGIPLATVQADAEVAIQACGRWVGQVIQAHAQLADDDRSPHAPSATVWPGGLTLCHGLGGALDLLVMAYEWSGVTRHLELARRAADAVLDASPEDPALWASGLRDSPSGEAHGCLGLFNGLAGTAVILARLAWPDRHIPSPAILG